MSEDEVHYALKDWPHKGSSVRITPGVIEIGNKDINLNNISAVDVHDAFLLPEWRRRFGVYEKWALAAVFVCCVYGLTQLDGNSHEGVSFAKIIFGSLLLACLFTFPITRGIWWLVEYVFFYKKLREDRLVLRIFMGRERVEFGPGEDSSRVQELESALQRALYVHKKQG